MPLLVEVKERSVLVGKPIFLVRRRIPQLEADRVRLLWFLGSSLALVTTTHNLWLRYESN